jgi:hypothetical protein
LRWENCLRLNIEDKFKKGELKGKERFNKKQEQSDNSQEQERLKKELLELLLKMLDEVEALAQQG